MSNSTAFRSSFKETTRKSISESNLQSLKNLDDELPLNDNERNLERLETMKVRKNALEETIEKKLNELRSLCLREGELTGVLPKEYPLRENEELPIMRRKVRTEFTFSDKLLMQPKTKEEEKLTKLELEFEIQCKIVKATSKLCNEMNLKKSIRKQRKQVYQQALAKLKDIEKNLQATKKLIEEEIAKKVIRKNSIRNLESKGGMDEFLNNNEIVSNFRNKTTGTFQTKSSSYSLNDEFSEDEENNHMQMYLRNKQQLPFELLSKDSHLLTMSSAPSTPVKCLKNKKLMNLNENHLYEFHPPIFTTNPRIENIIKQRHSNNNSPEYDTISSAASISSIGSANNLFLNNYCKIPTVKKGNEFNNYEELIENSTEFETRKLLGALQKNSKRTAIAPNLSQDDCNSIIQKTNSVLLLPSNKFPNERLISSLTRHNSLDKFKKQESLKSFDNVEDNILKQTLLSENSQFTSSNLLSPDQLNSQKNHFNFGLIKNLNNKSQNNINMAQRPLPSPPIEHKKTISATANKPQRPITLINNNSNNNKEKSFPAPLNLNNPPDHCLLKNSYQGGLLIKNWNSLKSPTATSMFLQSPLDFKKAASLYLNKQQNLSANEHSSVQSRLDTGNELSIKPVRSAVVRTPNPLTINTCSSDLQIQTNQHSQVPLLPPRTPITSKPNILNSAVLNTNQLNSINGLNLNSDKLLTNQYHQASNYSKNMISSSNPNLNSSSSILNKGMIKSEKQSKGWTETCIDTFMQPPTTNYKNLPSIRQNSNFYSMNSINDNKLNTNLNTNFNNNFNKLPTQLREKENQFINSNVSSRSNFNHQLINENSQSSLSSNSMLASSNSNSIQSLNASNTSSTNLHSSSQVFQPFLEEIKPYELSDFYKYSTKYKNSQKNLKKELTNELNPDVHNVNLAQKKRDSLNQDQTVNLTLNEESFLAKNQVASEFKNEMSEWLKEKYNSATLV